MTFRFEIYSKSSDGFGSGSYAPHLLRGASVQIERSLTEGDILKITSKRKDMDPQIDKTRPVRFYKDSVKLFDGLLRAPEYTQQYNKLRTLTTTAYSWEKELNSIRLPPAGVDYIDKSINFIFNDLCRISNDYGVTKKSLYRYDTSKIPYYGELSGVFETEITRTYSGSIWSAMQDLTQALDTASVNHVWEFALRVDALQSDFNIYIVPMLLKVSDADAAATFTDPKLILPKNTWRDYRLINFMDVWGAGLLKNQIYAPTPILNETAIPTNEEYFNAAVQPSARHYLLVTVTNPTGTDKTGSILINGSDDAYPPPPNELSERFFLQIPAYTARTHFTDHRYAGLATGALNSFRADSLSGCTLKVEEVLHGVAGRSINAFGLKRKSVIDSSLDSQTRVNARSDKAVRLYHAPLIYLEGNIKEDYAVFSDLVGKRVDFYDNFSGAMEAFVCTKQRLTFAGTQAKMRIEGMRYNIDWEYSE
ncbi:hypothetical protein ANME2D_00712 [Candidatus Methanoperedens nitroreducens]|uniref:Uncharacterized protein n=1 Tax=Candidatus Methanoperedens nitratireducens TaxID=1392998 RepID=A0A062VEL6_9EURY|nr:hypothetical protein [Candidatus Methanoperedens nitroreducens]KCZ73640.1 hypothetical protein ANME2D_00712 [Candidatus Methanoperedens nitroreducens]MDJ1422400.1 hypothetical protein [Candidatus Methanoperedens sp.]